MNQRLGGVTGKGFRPGCSGNSRGRPKGDGLVRKLILEAFKHSRKKALEALQHRLESPKTVQDVLELLAKLEGEMTKDSADGARGVSVIILANQGPSPLDPETFRAAARQKALEAGPPLSDA